MKNFLSNKANSAKNVAKATLVAGVLSLETAHAEVPKVTHRTTEKVQICMNDTAATDMELQKSPHIAKSINLVGRQNVCLFMQKNNIKNGDDVRFKDAVRATQALNDIPMDGILWRKTFTVISDELIDTLEDSIIRAGHEDDAHDDIMFQYIMNNEMHGLRMEE